MKQALILCFFLAFASPAIHAFQRVECMDRPDGSVYIFKRVGGQQNSLDVRIYHGWRFTKYSLPSLPIGIQEDFLNSRYDTRTAKARKKAIASFSPLERLIFNMDVSFHHEFHNCELSDEKVSCREPSPVKIGRVWISELRFFFDAEPADESDANVAYTIGIQGESTKSGVEFTSGKRYFDYGGFSQCLYLQQNGW